MLHIFITRNNVSFTLHLSVRVFRFHLFPSLDAAYARTTRKRVCQSTASAAGEHAEDGPIAAPEQVGEMEGITPAPQPLCPATAPIPTSLPAISPLPLLSHHLRPAQEMPA
jgi:hypothetical protein